MIAYTIMRREHVSREAHRRADYSRRIEEALFGFALPIAFQQPDVQICAANKVSGCITATYVGGIARAVDVDAGKGDEGQTGVIPVYRFERKRSGWALSEHRRIVASGTTELVGARELSDAAVDLLECAVDVSTVIGVAAAAVPLPIRAMRAARHLGEVSLPARQRSVAFLARHMHVPIEVLPKVQDD